MNQITWLFTSMQELTVYQLYDIVQLREQVFVVEQECIFLDADGIDSSCFHLMGYMGTTLIAYLRIVPPGISYSEPSLGRIVVHDSMRSHGLGKELVQKGISQAIELFGNQPLRIAAQTYLHNFYTSIGFQTIDTPFILDGIEHQYMILSSPHSFS